MRKQNNSKKKRAIFSLYGSNFLHRLLDIEKRFQKETDITREKLYLIYGCCFLIAGILRSIFHFDQFTPIAWLKNGLSIMGLLLSIILFLIVVTAIYFLNHNKFTNEYDEERNFTKSASGSHGTAAFMVGEEIKQVYGLCHENDLNAINGFVLGKVPNITQNKGFIGDTVTRDEKMMKEKYLSNRNTVIIGSPGTGKSAAIMIQNLIESAKRGESVFTTDPKGELCDKCSPIFRELGYEVKVFNLIYPWLSDKWNFMEWLSTLGADREKWISTISSMIIKNTSGERQDEFWASTADKLLRALMSFLLEIATPKAKLKDEKLEEYAEKLKQLRQMRNSSETIDEKQHLNTQIESLIHDKYKYLGYRIEQLKKQEENCTVAKEKNRLINMYRKLVAFRRDEMLLPILDKANPPDDYEPLTLAEAKRRILNISTCVRLLQLKISVSKEERSEFSTWMALPQIEKTTRLIYELAFQVPYENRSYKTLLQVFSVCDPNRSLAYSYWASFTESSENVCTSVKGGLDTRLSAFNQHYIRQMTSENEIDLEKPGREKCAYFCIISDQETSLSYISSLFITVAFEILRAQADASPNKCLHRRTMFYLDEFSNIGVLPDYTKKLSTLRSRDIHIIMAIQNLPQLLQRYDENLCLEMFGDCDLMLFLGCGNETKTPEFVSKLMGQMTTSTIVKHESKNILSPIKDFNYQMTEQQAQRDLMYINEIRELDQNRMIALTRGQKPMLVDKYMYFHRPDYKWIKKTIEKYPIISGHPLPNEEIIDLNALGSYHPSGTYLDTFKECTINTVPQSVSDTMANKIDLQMKFMHNDDELKDFIEYLTELKSESKYTKMQLKNIINQILGTDDIKEQTFSEQSESHVANFNTETVKNTHDNLEQLTDGFIAVETQSMSEGNRNRSNPYRQNKYQTPQITRKLTAKNLDFQKKIDPKDM